MTEQNVIYTQAWQPDAGAIKSDTNVATHARASDSAEVQDVYIDNIPAGGYISTVNSTEDDYLLLAAWFMFMRQSHAQIER